MDSAYNNFSNHFPPSSTRSKFTSKALFRLPTFWDTRVHMCIRNLDFYRVFTIWTRVIIMSDLILTIQQLIPFLVNNSPLLIIIIFPMIGCSVATIWKWSEAAVLNLLQWFVWLLLQEFGSGLRLLQSPKFIAVICLAALANNIDI